MSLALPLPSAISGSGFTSNTIQQFDSNVTITDVGSPARLITELNGIEVLRINNDGKVGIGTSTITSKKLEIDDSNGQALRLTYNNSTNYSDLCVDNTGQLILASSGSDVKINLYNSLDIIGHNGTTVGLKLAGVLVCASAAQLSYNCIDTPGIAQPVKTLVTDIDNNISGLNTLSLETINVTNFNVTNFAITGLVSNYAEGGIIVNGFSGTDMQGRLIHQSVETTLNFSDFNPNNQISNYSLEIIGYIKPEFTEDYTFYITADDGARLWVNNILIHSSWNTSSTDSASITISLTAEEWYPIRIHAYELTGAQRLLVQWKSISQGKAQISSTRMAWDNTENNININPIRIADEIILYDSESDGINTGSIEISPSGILNLNSISNNINIPNHNGLTTGLQLEGMLITASALELNYNDITTTGIAEASKSLVLDSNRDITNINNLTTTNITGTLQTPSQSNITDLGTLTKLNTSGSNVGINTSIADMALEINETSGNCLRLTHDDSNGNATNYCDFSMDSDGKLFIKPTGDQFIIEAEDSGTNDIINNLQLYRYTTETADNNFGLGLQYNIENNIGVAKETCSIQSTYTDISNGNEDANILFNTISNGILTQRADLDHLGQLSVTNVIETSDMRVKENFVDADLEESFKKIKQIQIKDYNFIDDPNKKIKRGVIAQQLKEIIPAAVEISKKNGYDDFHGVDTKELVGHLIASIQYIIKK